MLSKPRAHEATKWRGVVWCGVMWSTTERSSFTCARAGFSPLLLELGIPSHSPSYCAGPAQTNQTEYDTVYDSITGYIYEYCCNLIFYSTTPVCSLVKCN